MLAGFKHHPEFFSRPEQEKLVAQVRECLSSAPLFTPEMPRTGKPFSVRMSNAGELGWVSDRDGYRYQPYHPQTGKAWPSIPELALEAWERLCPNEVLPEACLINYYAPTARMGLHQDADEVNRKAPVLSISLGDTAVFRIGGTERKGPTRSLKLSSGDAVLLGGHARDAYHGVDRILAGSSTLLSAPGRVNLTLRRVNPQTHAHAFS